MKIIDLLNKIAKGEEVPEKIFYSDKIWYWDTRENDYVEDYKRLFNYYLDECLISSLNDEIEIIEEDKKDEEIELYVNGEKVDITDIYEPLKQGEFFYKENGKWYIHKLKNVSFVIEEDKKIEKLLMIDGTDNILLAINQTRRKINEIIDKINGE